MPLQRGEVQGYDFNRSVVEFTMLNQGNVIPCAISTAAMDNIEGKHNVRPDQHEISLCGCARYSKSEHHVSFSKRRPKAINPWCYEPTIFLSNPPCDQCPLYPRKRTCAVQVPMSALGQ
jgi:uncharacterized protein DUF1488